MQEALSDHHSRASTSLQVPKMKGGLLQYGETIAILHPPSTTKITNMKTLSRRDFWGPIPVRRKGGWVTKETKCFPYLPFPFPESSLGRQRSLRPREREGGGECRRIRGYPPAPQTSPESRYALSPSVPSPPLHPFPFSQNSTLLPYI